MTSFRPVADPRKQGVIHKREPIVRPRIAVGCAAIEDARAGRVRTGTDQPPMTEDSPVVPGGACTWPQRTTLRGTAPASVGSNQLIS